jgi:hypothetical protein
MTSSARPQWPGTLPTSLLRVPPMSCAPVSYVQILQAKQHKANHISLALIVYKIILHNIRFNSAFDRCTTVRSFARGAVVVIIESAIAYSGMITLYLVLLVISSPWCLVIAAVVSVKFV